jgi:hypothetical protein
MSEEAVVTTILEGLQCAGILYGHSGSIKDRMSIQGLHYTHFLWDREREEMGSQTKTLR